MLDMPHRQTSLQQMHTPDSRPSPGTKVKVKMTPYDRDEWYLHGEVVVVYEQRYDPKRVWVYEPSSHTVQPIRVERIEVL